VLSDNKFTYTIGETSILCEMAYSNVCAASGSDVIDSCASMGFCLTDDTHFPNDFNGLIALGKWNPNVTEISYIMEMYLQN